MEKENQEMSTMKTNSGDHDQFSRDQTPSAPPGLPGLPPTYAEAIVTQPQPADQNKGNHMPMPAPMPGSMPGFMPTGMPVPPAQVPLLNCPPGIDYLSAVDQLGIHQEVDPRELITGVETENKYQVVNSSGQMAFYAVEKSDFFKRNCYGAMREFDMSIFDIYQNEVIHLYRPLACCCCCCCCCLQSIEVASPPGNVIGSVVQKWSIGTSSFAVNNASGDTVLRIKGPCCTSGCGSNVDFTVTNSNGSEEVGKITRQWRGWESEMMTDSDIFGIHFPMDLDVRMKAVLLGGVFLIDMMFFEATKNKPRGRRGRR